MKIVAGLGSIDEYETFVKAGADEFFCGYVPFSWAEKYGVIHPLNRREVLFYNVQIGSMSELQILKKMVDYYGKPVKLTFNSLYYTGEQYPVIAEIITQCMAAGFENFIIADPALILYLRQQKINCGIHLSGETAEVNRGMLEQMLPFGIRRVIFHRKNSLHCDELTHLCRVPYELGNLHKKEETDAAQKDVAETDRIQEKEGKGLPLDEDGYLTGSTGCGLCALYRMKQVGITHLKLVGRGNYTDFMEKDIRQLRKALDILEKSDNELQYQREMKASLFPDGCSQNCYYR